MAPIEGKADTAVATRIRSRRFDYRIFSTAVGRGHHPACGSHGADRAVHAILIVDAADKHGKAKVSLLHRYERRQ
jgi:hypothetical protein